MDLRDPQPPDLSEPAAVGFPGRRAAAISLLVAPLLLLTGELLKAPTHFYFPDQLRAYAAHPVRWQLAYALWTAGLICLWPAFIALVSLISKSRPWLGRITGAVAFTGLMVNAFYEGMNHFAFELVKVQGVAQATAFVEQTYGWFSLAYGLTWTDNLAWILLAVGVYLIRLTGPLPALAIAFMATHASGVLKGYNPLGVVGDVLLLGGFAVVASRMRTAQRGLGGCRV